MNPRASKLSKALLELSQVADTVLRVSNAGVVAMRGKGLSNAERCLLERIDGFRSIEQVLAISGDLIGVHAALGKLVALSLVVAEGEPDTTPVEPPVAKRPAPPPPVQSRPFPPAPVAPVRAAPPAPAAAQPPAAARKPQPLAAVAKAPPAVAPAPAAKPAPAKPVAAKPAVAAAPPAKPAVPPKPPAAPPSAAAPKAALTELAQAKALLRIEAGQLFGAKAQKVIEKVDACKSVEEIYDVIVKVQGLLAKTGKGDPDVFLDRLTSGLQRIRAAQKAAAPVRRG